MDLREFGKRVKAAREDKGLTQEKLAELLDLSPTHVSVIERGVKAPRLDTFVRLANTLGVSADELLQDVVEHSQVCVANALTTQIMELPHERRTKIINALNALIE